MRLRTARKIMNADLSRYRTSTLGRVHRRWAKCESARLDAAYFRYLLRLNARHRIIGFESPDAEGRE